MTARLARALAAFAAALATAGCASGNPPVAGARGSGAAPQAAVGEITVAAASDLRLAFEELGAAFARRAGTKVTFSFGSSGQLAEQILNGAPFDVFASANVEFVDKVVKAGRAIGATKATYAFGRIVVFSPSKGPKAITTLEGLAAPAVRRVAIANPEHAPYGVAAVQALRAAGVYDAVRPKLVYGENVADTLRLATTGNADAAIVALSLVIARKGGTWALIDGSLHQPLEQALVVTGADPARTGAARAFVSYVGSPEGRAVMRRYGFLLPGEVAG